MQTFSPEKQTSHTRPYQRSQDETRFVSPLSIAKSSRSKTRMRDTPYSKSLQTIASHVATVKQTMLQNTSPTVANQRKPFRKLYRKPHTHWKPYSKTYSKQCGQTIRIFKGVCERPVFCALGSFETREKVGGPQGFFEARGYCLHYHSQFLLPHISQRFSCRRRGLTGLASRSCELRWIPDFLETNLRLLQYRDFPLLL